MDNDSLQGLPPLPAPSEPIKEEQPTSEITIKSNTSSKKRLPLILGGVGFMVLLAIIGATYFLTQQNQDVRKKAAPATSLSFSSSPTTPKVGDAFTINLNTNTGTNTASAAEILVKFDSSLIKVNSITAGNFFTNGNTISNSANNTTGTAEITLLASPTNPVSGTGTLAVINATALQAGSASISFDPSTKMAGIGEGSTNIITRMNPLTITINQTTATAPTASPTTQPTATLTNAPTSTPTNTPAPTSTPTTTPTNTPAPTTLPEAGIIDNVFIIGSFGLAAFIIPLFFLL